MSTPRSHSIQARLLNFSRERQVNHNHTLARYGIERLMYRLSRSPHGERFVLKGAMLFVLWLDGAHGTIMCNKWWPLRIAFIGKPQFWLSF